MDIRVARRLRAIVENTDSAMRKKPGTTERFAAKPRRQSAVGNPLQAGANGAGAAAASKTLAASGPKSLMKTSALGAGRPADRRTGVQPAPSSPSIPAQRRKPRPSNISGDRQQKIEERIAAATEQLSAGTTEAASAAEQLRRSMEQIASGAEQAASAAQETLAVATATAATLAQARLADVLTVCDRKWRGVGEIPESGLGLREPYTAFDAGIRFGVSSHCVEESPLCQSGLVLQGQIKPHECPAFGAGCTPEHPLGATMVSSEGACAAYFRYRRQPEPVAA